MENNFNIHLISNVSPDTFPNNNPAEFSTILADEIELKSEKWEVGVQQIMYPNNVAIMTEDKKVLVYEYDYDERFKKLLPFPKRNSPQTLLNTGIKFNWNFRWRPKNLTPETIEAKMVKFILDEINNDKKWNHIIKMDYKKKSKLFGIHLYHDDIVFVMDPGLCQLFGFKRNCYTKGTYWAQSPLTRVILTKINNRTNLNAFLIDLRAIEKQQKTLIQSKESDKIVFTKTYEQQIKDGSENRTVKVSFGLHPQDGEIKISVPKDLSEILFFRFDDKTRRKLNLERIYYPGNKQRIKIPRRKQITASIKMHRVAPCS